MGSFSKVSLSSKVLALKFLHLVFVSFCPLFLRLLLLAFFLTLCFCAPISSWVLWSSPCILGFVKLGSIMAGRVSVAAGLCDWIPLRWLISSHFQELIVHVNVVQTAPQLFLVLFSLFFRFGLPLFHACWLIIAVISSDLTAITLLLGCH